MEDPERGTGRAGLGKKSEGGETGRVGLGKIRTLVEGIFAESGERIRKRGNWKSAVGENPNGG